MSNENNTNETSSTKSRKKPLRMEKVQRILIADGGKTVVVKEEVLPGFNRTFLVAQVSEECPFLAEGAVVEVPAGKLLVMDGDHRAAFEALKGALKVSVSEGKLESEDLYVDGIAIRVTNTEKYGESTIHSIPDFGATNGFTLLDSSELEWDGDTPSRLEGRELLS